MEQGWVAANYRTDQTSETFFERFRLRVKTYKDTCDLMNPDGFDDLPGEFIERTKMYGRSLSGLTRVLTGSTV